MGRPLSVRWCNREGAWCSDCGEPFVDKNGRRRRRTVHFRGIPKHNLQGNLNRPAAIEARDRWALEHAPKQQGLHDPTCKELFDAYMVWCRANNEPNTAKGMKNRMAVFLGYKPEGSLPFGQRKAKTITPLEVAQLQRAMKRAKHDLGGKDLPKGYSNRYIASVTTSAVTVWNWAARPILERTPTRIFESNPLEKVAKPKAEPKKYRYATPAEIDAFLEFVRGRGTVTPRRGLNLKAAANCAVMLETLIETGARPDEICRATWDDYDPEVGALVYDKHKTSRSTGTQRTIYLSETLVKKIRENPPSRGGRHLFCNHWGRPWKSETWTNWFRLTRKLAIAMGIPCPEHLTSYWLRHAAMSNAMMAGNVDKGTVAKLMGTSEKMIDSVYGHHHPEVMRQAAAKVRQSREHVRRVLEGKGEEPAA